MLSVAPAACDGTTGRPGKRACTALDTAVIRSGRRGEAGLSTEPSASRVMPALGSAITWTRVWRTASAGVPGKIRQFTVAAAFWGRAFGA